MRLVLVLLVAVSLGACSDNHLPAAGDAGATDLARSSATDLARVSVTDLGRVDLAGGVSCISACNRCANGPCCGTACCNSGEYCDANNQCRCGMGAGCIAPLFCATGGPVMIGPTNGCGEICCGDSSHPCPL